MILTIFFFKKDQFVLVVTFVVPITSIPIFSSRKTQKESDNKQKYFFAKKFIKFYKKGMCENKHTCLKLRPRAIERILNIGLSHSSWRKKRALSSTPILVTLTLPLWWPESHQKSILGQWQKINFDRGEPPLSNNI